MSDQIMGPYYLLVHTLLEMKLCQLSSCDSITMEPEAEQVPALTLVRC